MDIGILADLSGLPGFGWVFFLVVAGKVFTVKNLSLLILKLERQKCHETN